MLDFKELSKDGTSFEMLLREVLFAQGLDVASSGVGPDGGKDLICVERLSSLFGSSSRRWLIQCKHFAHSGRSVGTPDIDNIRDSCSQHGVQGYVLAASTYLSSSLVNRLEGIAADPAANLLTSYIDGPMIERLLLSPNLFHVAQRFFPISASRHEWNVSRTDRPNHFIVNYKGYLFHLTNRIGSNFHYHFDTIKNRIEDIESIPHPEGHFIRPRAFWYDDKNGGYSVHLDYMIPHTSKEQRYSERSIARSLGDGNVMEDGQFYSFDVVTRRYHPHSDHHDVDHYSYYTPYIGSFLIGEGRDRSTIPSGETGIIFTSHDDDEYITSEGKVVDAGIERPFNQFVDAVSAFLGTEKIGARNAYPEALDLISRGKSREAWDIYGTSWDFNKASFYVSTKIRERTYELIEHLEQGLDISLTCREGWTFIPNDDGGCSRSFDDADDRLMFVTFEAPFAETPQDVRQRMNSYFAKMSSRLREALAKA
jgi:Restriction endonuclease